MTNEEAIKRLKEVQAEFNENWVDYGGINEAFKKAYKALEEKPQGDWINHRDDYGHNIADCSECGKEMQWHDEDEDGIPRYCWYCGAKMRGVRNELQ